MSRKRETSFAVRSFRLYERIIIVSDLPCRSPSRTSLPKSIIFTTSLSILLSLKIESSSILISPISAGSKSFVVSTLSASALINAGGVAVSPGDISGFLTVETAFLFICPSLQQTITKGMLKKTTTSRIIITMRSACFFAVLPSPRFFIFYSSR